MNQAFEDEESDFMLTCEVEGEYLLIGIEDPEQEEVPFVSIGLSQICNLIEFLINVRKRLQPRCRGEEEFLQRHIERVKNLNVSRYTGGYF